jgi:hypothetical protein
MEINEMIKKPESQEVKILETRGEGELSETNYKDIVKEQLKTIENMSLESLRTRNDMVLADSTLKNNLKEMLRNNETSEDKKGLSEDEKNEIREAHPDWPDEIIDAIESWDAYKIYDKAGLKYAEINGKPCLIRGDIDLNQKDEFGRTNKERMEQGLVPLDINGKPIELHHIRQKADGPLAELTQEEHRGRGNDSILHDKTKPTEIDRGEFQKEKEAHWGSRAG